MTGDPVSSAPLAHAARPALQAVQRRLTRVDEAYEELEPSTLLEYSLQETTSVRGPGACSSGQAGPRGEEKPMRCSCIGLQGKWGEILDLPGRGPPADARALCPDGGFEYATAIFHYARTLALAAKAEGAAAIGDLDSVKDAYLQGAATSLQRLEVRAAAA